MRGLHLILAQTWYCLTFSITNGFLMVHCSKNLSISRKKKAHFSEVYTFVKYFNEGSAKLKQCSKATVGRAVGCPSTATPDSCYPWQCGCNRPDIPASPTWESNAVVYSDEHPELKGLT